MAGKKTFESSMKRIEKIVETLEKGDTPLEQAISLFEEAAKLSRECMETLQNAEQKVLLLQKNPSDKEEPELTLFDAEMQSE